LVVGGGVIGVAVARAISLRTFGKKVVLVEKEPVLAYHTSGRNSGVVHSGINQKPGTMKARFCVDGNRALRDYCSEKGVAILECGTVVVANNDKEEKVLNELLGRGKSNGVQGVRLVSEDELREIEPKARGTQALVSPTGSIVDSRGLVRVMASEATSRGVQLVRGCKVRSARKTTNGVEVSTTKGLFSTKALINCAGLQADRIARMLGYANGYSIIPFRGQYYKVVDEKREFVHSMIYPTPDLEFPFLGVHFTRRYDGALFVGPNAVPVLGREAYELDGISFRDALGILGFPGSLRAAGNAKFDRLLLKEIMLAASRSRFIDSARRLVPEIHAEDVVPQTPGIRAQLIDLRGNLIDDFLVEWGDSSIHVLNAVSPGLTCSQPFAMFIVENAITKGYFS
jgi:L-2-hydroxyglutarate oxidase